jgi:hypothetical protein
MAMTNQSTDYDHPPCCGAACQGSACWDCRGTGHPHAPSTEIDVAQNFFAPDGYRYGVMFSDGSVAPRPTPSRSSPSS